MKKPFLSPSSVSTFKKCPLCFWRDKIHKVAQPRGAFPSLPGGVDDVMKQYHDSHRSMLAAPEMVQELDGATLFSEQDRLNQFRNWRSGMKVEGDLYVVGGAVDDIIAEKGGVFSPYDYKSKGKEPEEGYAEKWYQSQVDIYALMMNGNGMPPSGRAHFRFVWPTFSQSANEGIRMAGKFVTISTDIHRADELLCAAATCLSSTIPPLPGPDCDFCNWLVKVKGLG